MTTLLVLGFLIGMRHALEADHIAAVATLAVGTDSLLDAMRQGAAWGLGHTVTLFVVCTAVMLVDTIIPAQFAVKLELAVGVMLIVLGGDLLRRMRQKRVHFHTHRHAGDVQHFHAHSHADTSAHRPGHHHHSHNTRGLPLRALSIGLMHGMAGSAALILITLETFDSVVLGLAYIALFGLGSMLGMAALSIVIAIPIRRSERALTWLHNGAQSAVGVFTVALGVYLCVETAALVTLF